MTGHKSSNGIKEGDKVERIYHPYWLWEDYINGMWRKENSILERDYLRKAIEFTGDAEKYGYWMLKVIEDWPITCEHNLTDETQNRKAFIGHCACCHGINCPEYITREAWGYLNKKQQDEANEKANIAITKWEELHGIRSGQNAQMLLAF